MDTNGSPLRLWFFWIGIFSAFMASILCVLYFARHCICFLRQNVAARWNTRREISQDDPSNLSDQRRAAVVALNTTDAASNILSHNEDI